MVDVRLVICFELLLPRRKLFKTVLFGQGQYKTDAGDHSEQHVVFHVGKTYFVSPRTNCFQNQTFICFLSLIYSNWFSLTK